MTNPDNAWREGACHCGAVRFRVRLAEGLDATCAWFAEELVAEPAAGVAG